MMCFWGGGVGHASTRKATDFFRQDHDIHDMRRATNVESEDDEDCGQTQHTSTVTSTCQGQIVTMRRRIMAIIEGSSVIQTKGTWRMKGRNFWMMSLDQKTMEERSMSLWTILGMVKCKISCPSRWLGLGVVTSKLYEMNRLVQCTVLKCIEQGIPCLDCTLRSWIHFTIHSMY